MRIEYNIFSRGTETDSNSTGYMAISELVGGKRYIMPIGHNIDICEEIPDGSIEIKSNASVYQIAFARFALISKLLLNRCKFSKKSKILVCGCGCVGYALLFNLKQMGFNNVIFTSRHQTIFNEYQWIDIKNIDFSQYEIIFDTTGANEIIESILDRCAPLSTIVLLGTHRHAPQIDILRIHRKNLVLMGAHELFGYSNNIRQKTFDQVLRLICKSRMDLSSVCGVVKSFGNKSDKIYQIIRKKYD